MKKTQRLCLALALFFGLSAGVRADDAVTVTFERGGTLAADVQATAAGVDGVSATLTSVSHSLKESPVATNVICPNVNGNTSPTITFVLTLGGLPTDFTFDNVGLVIHALNGNGGYQESNDNIARQWNVSIEKGTDESALKSFSSRSDIDIAAGVTSGSQNWDFVGSYLAGSSEPLVLKITVTAGTTNRGCFFGLSQLTLSNTGQVTTPETETEAPGSGETPSVTHNYDGVYTIKWKNNTASYMAQSGTGIVIDSYSVNNKIFWRFIPTDKEECYYIQNTATGQYIGSCNMTPSSASKVSMSDTPVEYFVGVGSATSGDNAGCLWLSSTDCSSYNVESAGARCLNKDGASSNIITWTTGTANVGSYWTFTATEDLYEVKAFTPAAAIGAATAYYQIVSTDGSALTAAGEWTSRAFVDAQKWYFVGTSNAAGGYQIVNAAGAALNDGACYTTKESATQGYYNFLAGDGSVLTIAGKSEFKFVGFRSRFAMASQMYSTPCGNLSNSNWISEATISSEAGTLYYPQPSVSGTTLSYPSATKPTSRYTILSRDAAVVTSEGATLNVTLAAAPADGLRTFVYVDWDRDGVFEYSEELTGGQVMSTQLTPGNAASNGLLRLRLRLTDNGLSDADDDVNGQVVDLMINYVGEAGDAIAPMVTVNEFSRGTATYDAAAEQATATAKGTSLFLYWKEGSRLLATTSTIDAAPTTSARTLTAYFSPNNLDLTNGFAADVLRRVDDSVVINVVDGKIVVTGGEVQQLLVFDLNGRIVTPAAAVGTKGVYVVKAITATGVGTQTIAIN